MVTPSQRNSFKRIISQLDKAKTDAKVLKVVTQVNNFMREHDIGWDAVTLLIPGNYIYVSDRKRAKVDKTAIERASSAANGHAGPLGRDARALLKTAVSKHPDWSTVRETLDIDLAHVTVAELVAVAQLLNINEQFIKLFLENQEPVTAPAQPQLL
jgi:hypothetical protein